jgi:hypothetical protein
VRFAVVAQQVRDLGCGSFGVAQLMRDTATGELVAVKKLERGSTVTLYHSPALER